MIHQQNPNYFRFYTDDKTPELTLFYNLACDRVDRFIISETAKKYSNGQAVEDAFKKAVTDGELLTLPDILWIKLKNYLWKGYSDDRNSSGTHVSDAEKHIIQQMIARLYYLRNFQSHFYHKNDCLFFDYSLAGFIEERYEWALNSLSKSYPDLVAYYRLRFKQAEKRALEERMKNGDGEPGKTTLNPEYVFIFRRVGHNDSRKLTYEGKGFFLSFFLTKGEMIRFLKQRRGAKRDDLREFKIKHEIYTFYCHREGATRFHYNQDSSWLDGLQAGDRAEILKIKKSLALVSYLNDIPDYLFDTGLFPIPMLKPGSDARENLLLFISRHKLFANIEWSLTLPEVPPKPWSKPPRFPDRRRQETPPQPETHLVCQLKEWPGFTFKISPQVVHRMILHALWLNDNGLEATRGLFALMLERHQLQRLFKLLENDQVAAKIAGSPRHSQKLFDYLNDFSLFKIRNGSPAFQETWDRWLKLPAGDPAKAKSNSLTRHDLYEKVKYFAKWLPIEVRFEHLFLENSRKPRNRDQFMHAATEYLIDFEVTPNLEWHWETFGEAPEEIEHTLKENAATCFAEKEPGPGWRLRFTPDNQVLCRLKGSTRPFLIGHKAMRNLLTAHLKDKHNPVTLFEAVKEDLDRLLSGTPVDDLKLLDKSSIPAAVAGSHKHNLLKAVKTRIGWLKEQLNEQLKNADEYRRAEKNRQVMQCYRLFDWPRRKSNGVEMFLRHNEYNQMSIYHYMLEKRRLKNITDEIMQERQFPPEVWSVLNKSGSLDQLHTRIIRAAMQLLDRWQHSLPANAEKIARKLGVPLYLHQGGMADHVPFAIHPVLVVKHFYGEELRKEPRLNLSGNYRKQKPLFDALETANYNPANLVQTLREAGAPENLMKKATGTANDQLTHDMLLLAILQKYDPEAVDVKKLFDKEHTLTSKQTKFAANLQMRKREMNSILYTFGENDMNKLIGYYLRRHPAENTGGTPTLKFSELIKERQRIEQASLIYIRAILDFEKEVLGDYQGECPEKGYLNLNDIGPMAGLPPDQQQALGNIRNTAFHCDTPKDWTYGDDEIKSHPVLKTCIEQAEQNKAEREQYYLQGLKPPRKVKPASKQLFIDTNKRR